MKIRFSLILIHIFLVTIELGLHAHDLGDEPQCYSRFDYDYKIQKKLIELENAYTELKTTNKELQKDVEMLKGGQGKAWMEVSRYLIHGHVRAYMNLQ